VGAGCLGGWCGVVAAGNCTAARCGGFGGVVRGYRFAQPTATHRHRVAMQGWLGAVARDRGVEAVVQVTEMSGDDGV
jgi:hypothetical protein